MSRLSRSRRGIRGFCFTVMVLACAIGFQVLVSEEAIAQPVKLGLIDMYTGPSAFIANTIKAGFEIAVEEANATGGAAGKTLAVETADMGTSTEKAVTELRRMVLQDKIPFVTIGIHSGAAVAAASLAKEMKFLLGAGFATTKRLTGEAGSRYVCRANITTVEIGNVMAEYLRGKPEIKTVATIAPDYEYGQHFVADFKAGLAKARPDIKVLREEWPKLGTGDMTPHVTALQAVKPDAVVGGIFGGDLLNFFKASKDFGLDKQARFFWNAMAQASMTPFKDVVPEGTWNTLWYPFYDISNSLNTKFLQEFEKKMKTYPTDGAIVGYYAAKMIIQAMRKARTTELERVIDALGDSEFEAPTGGIKVRRCDQMAFAPVYVGSVKRDAKFRDGIGFVDIKSFPMEKMARSCEEIMKARQQK